MLRTSEHIVRILQQRIFEALFFFINTITVQFKSTVYESKQKNNDCTYRREKSARK